MSSNHNFSTQFTCSTVLGFSGGANGNLSVKCGSPTETIVTTTRTAIVSTSIITSPIESTSLAVNNKKPDATRSSITGNTSFDSLFEESTQDNPEMICNYAVEQSYRKKKIENKCLSIFVN